MEFLSAERTPWKHENPFKRGISVRKTSCAGNTRSRPRPLPALSWTPVADLSVRVEKPLEPPSTPRRPGREPIPLSGRTGDLKKKLSTL